MYTSRSASRRARGWLVPVLATAVAVAMGLSAGRCPALAQTKKKAEAARRAKVQARLRAHARQVKRAKTAARPEASKEPTAKRPRTARRRNPDFFPEPSAAERKILEKLEEPVTLEFIETPLGDVVDFMRQMTNLNVILDRLALEEEGVTSDSPVTIQVQQVPLKSALKLLLGALNATYVARDDMLLVTSVTGASHDLSTRVYPVRDLCSKPEELESLAEIVQQTLSPESWSAVGGAGSIKTYSPASSLVISQTYEVHGQVLELLRALRAAKKLVD